MLNIKRSHLLKALPIVAASLGRKFDVKSQEEKMIADWLALNGIDYRYEKPCHVDMADAEHGQYHPDFYYPDADVYHEHLALDASGQPPAPFRGAGSRLKRPH